jgi:hypothetical protein
MQKYTHSQNQKQIPKIILKTKFFRIIHVDLMAILNKENGINYDSIGIEYRCNYKMLGITYDHTFEIINEDLFLDFYNKQNIEVYPC